MGDAEEHTATKDEDTRSLGDVTETPTEVRPDPAPSSPTESTPSPTLDDVKRTVGDYSRSLHQRCRDMITHHVRTLIVLGVALLIIGVMIALSTARAVDKPSLNQASSDIANRAHTPSYDPHEYGRDGALSLDAVDYVEINRDGERCFAIGVISYTNDSVTAHTTVRLDYARSRKGMWVATGTAHETKTTWSTTAGADPDKVLADAGSLLQKADIALREQGDEHDQAESLYALYRDAEATILREHFDQESLRDTFVIHFDDTGTFTRHSCDLTVVLTFRTSTGIWEVTSCTPDEHAWQTDYAPLVGDWQGTFQSQTSDGHNCYGARKVPLKVIIENVEEQDDGSLTLTGSFSALVHHHENLSADADTTSGDETVTDEVFSGTLSPTDTGLIGTFTTAESADGTLSLELTFGHTDDPHDARAKLTTAFNRDNSFLLIPYSVSGSFTDNYTLTKRTPEESDDTDTAAEKDDVPADNAAPADDSD